MKITKRKTKTGCTVTVKAETEADKVCEHVGAGTEQAMGLIVDFRKYRAEKTGKSQGPTRPNDWVG